jgi:O-antigen ligase
MSSLVSAPRHAAEVRERRTVQAPVLGAIALAVLGFSGYFKRVIDTEALPIDLTLLGVVLVMVMILWNLLQHRPPSLLIAAVVFGLWATFLPAALIAPATDAASRKIVLLLTVTLACALGPFIMDRRGLQVWIGAQVVAGTAMAVVLWTHRDNPVAAQSQRLAIEEVDTIATSRVLGGAVLVLLLLGLSRRALFAPCLAAAAGGIALMLAVGSRGPTLSLGLALLLLAALTRMRHRWQRLLAVGTAIVAGTVFLIYVLSSRSDSVQRIAGALTGLEVDQSRQYLYTLALNRLADSPLGLGWGGFATLPSASPFLSARREAYPHNFFLEIGVEAGLLALLATMVYCVICLERLRRGSHDLVGRILFGLGVYWLLVAQTSSDINGNRMTWIALSVGLLGTASRRVGEKSRAG